MARTSSSSLPRPFAVLRNPLPRIAAVALLLFGFLPIANWIPGGHEAEWYDAVRSEWMSGSLLAFGIAAIIWILARRIRVWPEGLGQRLGAWAQSHSLRASLALFACCFGLYCLIALRVFSGKPLLIDEIAQVIQARIFASGSLWLPSPQPPEFFSILHLVDAGGRTFSQFPPGGPLMLVPGVLLGLPWLTGPVFAALAVVLYWQLVRRFEESPTVSLGATVLFGVAPFAAFMAGSHMNHVTTLFWLCGALFCLSQLTSSDIPRPTWAVACGFCFGVMATIRPTDAAVFALPAAVWLLARAARRPGCWRDVGSAGIAIALPILALMAFNAATTGRPLLFGYELLWGKSHALGFHQAPWGVMHTPARGLELINLYFLRLQTYLFETPVPSLAPCVVALAITPAVRGFDRYLLWSSALLVVSYFAYWHDGFYLGPRFFYLLLPVLVLWTARLPRLLAQQFPANIGIPRFALIVYATAGAIALYASVPLRVRQYAGGLTSMRQDYVGVADAAQVRDALILVKESWGAQLIARMWALGVPHSATETLYRGVDTCQLDQAVTHLERNGVHGANALAMLSPLLRDSAHVVKSNLSPDETERILQGVLYTRECVRQIEQDRSGYTFLAPVLAARPRSNVYARDLGARDTLLFAAYPGRPVYLLRPVAPGIGTALRLVRLSRDSIRDDWRNSATR